MLHQWMFRFHEILVMLKSRDVALQALSERQRKVLFLLFGISETTGKPECGPRTLREVGEILGITRGRVSQLEQTALEKLGFKITMTYKESVARTLRKL